MFKQIAHQPNAVEFNNLPIAARQWAADQLKTPAYRLGMGEQCIPLDSTRHQGIQLFDPYVQGRIALFYCTAGNVPFIEVALLGPHPCTHAIVNLG